jgi:short-subunit dehydrogenase
MNAPAKRVVVITGGAGGIGRAIAARYHRDGYRIALLDRDPDALANAAEEVGEGTTTHNCDITQTDCAPEIVNEIASAHGRIDLLVHCAGLTQVSLCRDTTLDVYRRVMDVNFFGAVALTQAVLPALIDAKGHIVVLSSVAGFAPLIGRTGYCAAKHALHGFFDTLRAELAPDGVGVTICCPTFTATNFANSGLTGDGSTIAFDRSTTGEIIHPQTVAEEIHRAVTANKPITLPGRTAKIAWWFQRLAPQTYARAMAKRFAEELTRNSD